jgi:hypothetical protein
VGIVAILSLIGVGKISLVNDPHLDIQLFLFFLDSTNEGVMNDLCDVRKRIGTLCWIEIVDVSETRFQGITYHILTIGVVHEPGFLTQPVRHLHHTFCYEIG